jgi:hypothetical protein
MLADRRQLDITIAAPASRYVLHTFANTQSALMRKRVSLDLGSCRRISSTSTRRSFGHFEPGRHQPDDSKSISGQVTDSALHTPRVSCGRHSVRFPAGRDAPGTTGAARRCQRNRHGHRSAIFPDGVHGSIRGNDRAQSRELTSAKLNKKLLPGESPGNRTICDIVQDRQGYEQVTLATEVVYPTSSIGPSYLAIWASTVTRVTPSAFA